MDILGYVEGGVLRRWWDDSTRTYHEADAQGVETLARPYTTAENADADRRAAERVADTNRQTIEQALADALATLQLIIDDTNANINSNPAQRIKDLARAQRRTIRLLIRRFDGTA